MFDLLEGIIMVASIIIFGTLGGVALLMVH